MIKKLMFGIVLSLMIPSISMAGYEEQVLLEKLTIVAKQLAIAVEDLPKNLIAEYARIAEAEALNPEKREQIRLEIQTPLPSSKKGFFRYWVRIYETEESDNMLGIMVTDPLPDCDDPTNWCTFTDIQTFITADKLVFSYEIAFENGPIWYWTTVNKEPPFKEEYSQTTSER